MIQNNVRFLFIFFYFYLQATEQMLHPSESQVLKKIMEFSKRYQDIHNFLMKYKNSASFWKDDCELQKGIYVEAFVQSMDTAIYPFRNRVLKLERMHIANMHLPINYFLKEILEFEALFLFLKQLISEIKLHQIHGCAVMGLLHKHNFQPDPIATYALKIIRGAVYGIFLRQLSQWLIFGRLVDIFQEFFVVKNNFTITKNAIIDGKDISTESTAVSEWMENNRSWQYKIAYPMIPPNFTFTWAEKVLFIGGTVCMLSENSKRSSTKISIWSDEDELLEIATLWNKQEHKFFQKIQNLYNHKSINGGSYENVINEIKLCVTERLSEISFNQADLMKHLKIFKDYFLLGRGELFLDFILELKNVKTRNGTNEHLARDANQAFQKALSRNGLDIDQIEVHLLIDDDIDATVSVEKIEDILKLIRLKFNTKWPLHLFFSPTALIQYDELFRYLLQIRQIQNELHNVWRMHRERKLTGNSPISQLRNRMLFLIDNLLYYLQVDVLDCQFTFLMNSVENSKNFEFIQRAHSVFLTNVMSLSFLLNTGSSGINKMDATLNEHGQITNPVRVILNDTFKTIRKFCHFNESAVDSMLPDADTLISSFVKQ